MGHADHSVGAAGSGRLTVAEDGRSAWGVAGQDSRSLYDRAECKRFQRIQLRQCVSAGKPAERSDAARAQSHVCNQWSARTVRQVSRQKRIGEVEYVENA